jgi:hypothetical protein
MLRLLPRRNRARPRLNYLRSSSATDRPFARERKLFLKLDGIMLVRCGGGHRILRRVRLP